MRRRSLAWLLLLAVPLLAQRKPVTLESISQGARGAAAGGAPLWMPDGKSFLTQQGSRVMIYDVGARAETEMFSTADMEKAVKTAPPPAIFEWENRRVREQRMQVSASGKEILLLLGGDLFLYRVAPKTWEQLTASPVRERDPKLSPDGRRVSYRLDDELYVLEIARKKTTRLTHDATSTRWNGRLDWVYPEELNIGTAHWWSPDSRSIAYLQFDVSKEMVYPHADLLKVHAVFEPQRYPYAGTPNPDVRLGVVAATGGKTRWLDPGPPADGLLARLDWTPSSREIVVQRLTRTQKELDLLAIDAATGKVRTVFKENAEAWINVQDDLTLLEKSPRLVWSSERDGFRHLYLYSLDGKELARLTGGNWEVSGVTCVDEAGERVFYTSTESSPLERHLYSVKFDGGDRRRLTQKPGTHTASMGPGCAYSLQSHSSLTGPSARTLHSADGAEIAVYRAADRRVADEYEILPTEIHTVRAADGSTMYARLIKPAGFQPGRKYPAIVMVYGGPGAQSVRDSWRGADFDQALAHRGFVIWQMDNRGAGGQGHVFEKPLHRRFGEIELADQRVGVKHLIGTGFVDPERIGIHGWSYGGYMTLMGMLHAPDVFRAGASGAPVTDWREYDTIYTERYMGLPAENEEGYRKSSPVHAAANLRGRLMLIHNFGDDNVLFQHTLRMADALQRAGKQFDLMVYPQKSHGVTGPARRHMLEGIAAFFERHLKN
jgi:dipeptidyl-peptidase-4